MELNTLYGTIHNVSYVNKDKEGKVCDCMLDDKNELHFSLGSVIPKYTYLHPRDKYRSALAWYPSGAIRSIYLEGKQTIKTSIGMIPAELVTFYESGSIRRVFPLYGQISGFWKEEEEYQLSEKILLSCPEVIGAYHILCIAFYESGAVKSITFWPGEVALVRINAKEIQARIGISFYESGEIKTLEPTKGCSILTPFGEVFAYDNNPNGITGDHNSLEFDQSKRVIRVSTIKTTIKIENIEDGTCYFYKAQLLPSRINLEEYEYEPIRLQILMKGIEITDSHGKVTFFDYDTYIISVYNTDKEDETCELTKCSNCQGCFHRQGCPSFLHG